MVTVCTTFLWLKKQQQQQKPVKFYQFIKTGIPKLIWAGTLPGGGQVQIFSHEAKQNQLLTFELKLWPFLHEA